MDNRESIDKKGFKFNEYLVWDSRIAKILIDTKKHMWFTEERNHWKTGKLKECWVFEFTDSIKEDFNMAKEIVFGCGGRRV